MALTKLQYRTLIQEFIEDAGAKRWSATNLDLLTQLRQDSLWRDLHDFRRYFTSQLDTITTTLAAPGVLDTAIGGDLSQRFLRIHSIVRNGRAYSELDPRELVLEGGEVKAQRVGGGQFFWFFFGNQLHLLPYSTDDDVEVRYAFLPPLYTSLMDATTVLWPEGHELALVYAVAADALSKGDVEDTSNFDTKAAREWQILRSAVSKRGLGPSMPYYGSTTHEWGGE